MIKDRISSNKENVLSSLPLDLLILPCSVYGRNIPPPSNLVWLLVVLLVGLLVVLRCLGGGHGIYDVIERGWRKRQELHVNCVAAETEGNVEVRRPE